MTHWTDLGRLVFSPNPYIDPSFVPSGFKRLHDLLQVYAVANPSVYQATTS